MKETLQRNESAVVALEFAAAVQRKPSRRSPLATQIVDDVFRQRSMAHHADREKIADACPAAEEHDQVDVEELRNRVPKPAQPPSP
ncbi:MAG: hypothetical protein P8R42_16075 [Candidatus Binatia bacterium]|nr:hypothetical protein [Candidatus Binatia bacterium]